MSTLSEKLDEGVREGIRQAFENNVYENCDGSNDPDDRCPSEGHCVCLYVRWRNRPWWRRLFVQTPPRASEEACQKIYIDRVFEEAMFDLVHRRTGRSTLNQSEEGEE